MILENRRGEVFTLTVVILAALAAFVLGSTQVSKWFGLGGQGQKTRQIEKTVTESKPYYIQGDDGKLHLIESTKTSTSTMDSSEEPKLTLWQKIWGLGKVWILLMVVAFLFPAGIVAKIMHTINAKAKAVLTVAHDGLHAETVKIVQSVDLALKQYDAIVASYSTMAANTTDVTVKATNQAIVLALTDAKKAILGTMGNEQDASTKVLVGKLKQQQ